MKFVSLQKLSLFSLSLFTLCFMGFANSAQAECDGMDELRSKRGSSRCDSFRYTQGIVLSTDIINTFVLRFSEAVRAGGSTAAVLRLQDTLDVEGGYSVSLVFPPFPAITATNFTELQALIQTQSSALFDISLNGNHSVECYKDQRGRRTLQVQGSQYVVQKVNDCLTNMIIASDQWTVVETRNNPRGNHSRGKTDNKCNTCTNPFRVKTLVATVLDLVPICTGCTGCPG